MQEAKCCGADEAIEWIRRRWHLAAIGAGLAFVIARAADDVAVGYVGLLARPRFESGIVDACRRGDSDGMTLVFESQAGSAGIGYWLLETARGEGLASRAVVLVSEWALTAAGLSRIEALVDPSNVPSHGVVQRAGFQPEGHLRAYLVHDSRRADAVIYSLVPADLGPL